MGGENGTKTSALVAHDVEAGRLRNGQWTHGAPAGPGRPALPAKLTSRIPDLIDFQLRVVFAGKMPMGDPVDGEEPPTEVDVPPKTRAAVAADLLDRGLGRPRTVEQTSSEDAMAMLTAQLATALAAVTKANGEKK